MTNRELKEVLQEVLAGDMDSGTIVMLQAASLEAVLKLGLSLRGAYASYTELSSGYAFFTEMLGVDLHVMDSVIDEQEAQLKPTPTPEERKLFGELLKDIKAVDDL